MARFADVFLDVTKDGHKISKENYLPQGRYPIIDQGQEYIAGYSDESAGLYKDVPAIIFGDHTRIIKYVNTPCFLGADGVKLLKAKIPDSNYKYLYYALSHTQIPNTGYNRHFKWLKEVDIRLPSESEQQYIVEILDKLSTLISLRKQQLSKLDELIQVRFVEMFGDLKQNTMNWPVCSFADFARIDTAMIHDFTEYSEFPHIGIDSIEKDTGNLSGYRTVKEDGVISGKYLFTPEHIIYSKIRPNLNKVALPGFVGVCSADAYPILPKKEKCNRVFLAFTLRSHVFLDYILAFSSRTNLPKVNKQQVEGFCCPIPDIKFQKQFASFYDEVVKQKLTVQQSLDKLEVLKKSLMQEYFSGE